MRERRNKKRGKVEISEVNLSCFEFFEGCSFDTYLSVGIPRLTNRLV